MSWLQKLLAVTWRQNAPVGTPIPDTAPYDVVGTSTAVNGIGGIAVSYDPVNGQMVVDGSNAGTGAIPKYVTALSTYTPVGARQSLQIDGYSASGDGGGGTFVWNALDIRDDDGGTIIAVTGIATGRWSRVTGLGAQASTWGHQSQVVPDWWGTGSSAIESAIAAALPFRVPVHLGPHAHDTGTTGVAIASAFSALRGAGAPATDYVSLVSAASNASPIVLSTFNTIGIVDGMPVYVQGVGGNLAANGLQTVASHTSNSVTLDGTTGSGNYTSGGAIADAAGSTIVYSGTDTAVAVGVSPGSGSTYLNGTKLHDFRIQCVDATALALNLWFLNAPTVERVQIYGPSGAGVGVQIYECIAPRLVQCNIRGDGSQASAASYMAIGVSVGSNPSTVVELDSCYIHGCQTGFQNYGSQTTCIDTIFENCHNHGFLVDYNGNAHFIGCHFEGNAVGTSNEGIGYLTAGCSVSLRDCIAIMYAGVKVAFVASAPGTGGLSTGSPASLLVDGLEIAGSNMVNHLFNSGSMDPATQVDLANLRFGGGPALASASNTNPVVLTLAKAATVTGAANNGSGLIRLTVDSTSTIAGVNVAQYVVASVGGTTEANGTWVVSVVDGTHIDLVGSTFTNPYTSGGTVTPSTGEITAGQTVNVVGVVGNNAANGLHQIASLTSTTITLKDVAGSGAYTSGGQVAYWGILEPTAIANTGEAADWRSVKSSRQRVVKYTFVQTGVAANTSYFCPPAGSTLQPFVTMPAKGYVVGMECNYSGTVSAGTVTLAAVQNALSGAVNMLLKSAASSFPVEVHRTIMSACIEKGDKLYAEATTSVGFAATGGDLVIDVYVAFGDP